MWLDGQILDRGADIGGGKCAHVDTASSQAITGNDPRLLHAVDRKRLTVKSGWGCSNGRRHEGGT